MHIIGIRARSQRKSWDHWRLCCAGTWTRSAAMTGRSLCGGSCMCATPKAHWA